MSALIKVLVPNSIILHHPILFIKLEVLWGESVMIFFYSECCSLMLNDTDVCSSYLMSSRFTELGDDPENSSARTHTFLAVDTDVHMIRSLVFFCFSEMIYQHRHNSPSCYNKLKIILDDTRSLLWSFICNSTLSSSKFTGRSERLNVFLKSHVGVPLMSLSKKTGVSWKNVMTSIHSLVITIKWSNKNYL